MELKVLEKIENVSTKQVIVMRKDLGMRKGKMVSQGSHASLGALLTMFDREEWMDNSCVSYYLIYCNDGVISKRNQVLASWLDGVFTKICFGVDNEEELISLYKKIKNEAPEIPISLIEDCGLTEFHGVKTKTCIGIGPWLSDEIDTFTKHLKLL